MAEDSKIEWTHHTFNPWRGCMKVSAGCANCYAETLSGRNPGTRVVAAEAQWRLPLKWGREAKAKGERHRVFCASMADVFEDWLGPMTNSKGTAATTQVPGFAERPMLMQDVRVRLLMLILATDNLDWLLLTKRPANVLTMLRDAWMQVDSARDPDPRNSRPFAIPPNVWIGTSVENQAAADERIPHLLKVPARVRFLSCEPLLGPVDLTRIPVPSFPGVKFDSLLKHGKGSWGTGARIDWCITGGESGPDSRTCRIDWMRSLVEQCLVASVPVFVKQLGQRATTTLPAGECWPGHSPKSGPQFSGDGFGNYHVLGLKDRKGGEPSEWPVELRVREFPETRR